MLSRGLVRFVQVKPSTCRVATCFAPRRKLVRFCSVTPPPPASASSSTSESPPPPREGLQCGGFFFALDPNIGLWNDRTNPNWRLTFTDRQTNTKQRIPYAFAIQNQGPHFELALRFQFGFVSCDNSFAVPPQSFEVESGWELSLPLPFSGLRVCYATLGADGLEGRATAAVYLVDFPFGLSAGFQKSKSGVGLKGDPDAMVRLGDVAMVAYVLAIMFGVWTFFTIPGTWLDVIDALKHLDDLDGDENLELYFEALDRDGDGYITREDLHELFRATPELRTGDADMLFDRLDPSGVGRVNFEQFQEVFAPLLQALENSQNGNNSFSGLNPNFQPQRQAVDMKPFGGVFAPGPGFSPLLGSVRPPTGSGPQSPWN